MISWKPDSSVDVELIKPVGISIEPDLGYTGGEASMKSDTHPLKARESRGGVALP